MFIYAPCLITPRLLPGVQVADAWISIEYHSSDAEGRTVYCWHFDHAKEGHHFSAQDLKSGCGGGSLQEGLASLLSFMSAGKTGLCCFPVEMHEWLTENFDELSMLQSELEQTEDLIDESRS